MIQVRDRWLVVILLLAATAGVAPQIGGTAGNLVAFVGIVCVGSVAILRSGRISVLRNPLTLFLCMACVVVLQSLAIFIRGGSVTFIQAFNPVFYLVIVTITVLVIPNNINSREALIGTIYTVTPIAGLGVLGVLLGSPIGGVYLTDALPVKKYVIAGPLISREVAVSIFGNPNRLSAFAISGVISGIGLWWTEQNVFGLVAAVISIIAVLLTGSRTPVLVLPIALTAGYLVWNQSQALLLAWLYTFMLLIPVVIGTTVVDTTLVGIVSESRAELWAGAVRAVMQQPLFGYGLGEFVAPLAEFVRAPWEGVQPHNGFAVLLVSGGLLLALSYVALLFVSITSRVRAGLTAVTVPWLILSVSYIAVQMVESFSMFSLTPTCMLIGLSTGYMIKARNYGSKANSDRESDAQSVAS